MRAIETTANVDDTCTLTITLQVPADVQAGKYEAMVVLNRAVESASNIDSINNPAAIETENLTENNTLKNIPGEQWSPEVAAAWAKIQSEAEHVELDPQPAKSEYHQSLIEKYRRQGLNL